MGRAIKEYSMGAVLQLNFTNIKAAHLEIVGWDKKNAAAFLHHHSWEIAVRQMLKYLP